MGKGGWGRNELMALGEVIQKGGGKEKVEGQGGKDIIKSLIIIYIYIYI